MDNVERLDKYTEVKKSSVHGKGLFCKSDLGKNNLIGSFDGKRTNTDGTHVLWLQDDDFQWYGIKGDTILKYMNHSSSPNAEFDDLGDLYALKKISSGEEIFIHYGEEWE